MLPLMLTAALVCGGYQHLAVDAVEGRVARVVCDSGHVVHVLNTGSVREGRAWPDADLLRRLHDQRNRLPRETAGNVTL